METVSGRVLGIERKKKDQNKLLIASHKFGTMIVNATLSDKDVEDIRMNDEVQISGRLRLRKWTSPDGHINRDVLVIKPVLERTIRSKTIAKYFNETKR